MRVVFVDTFYWIARINPRDQWHPKALALSSSLNDARFVTSAAVLVELLNYFSNYGPEMRKAVALIVRHIISDSDMIVVDYSPASPDPPSHHFDGGSTCSSPGSTRATA